VSAAPAPIAEIAAGPQLADEPRLVETLDLVHSLADRHGVAIEGCRPTPTGTLGCTSYRASGRADLAALCGFLAAVETHERLFAVTALKVRPSEAGRVEFELVVVAHHYEVTR
jgi:hypothetical protein